MIRNLKALGLVMVAAIAMSSIMSSAASAQQGMLTSDGPVTLHGEAGTYAWFTFGVTGECKGASFTGHKYNVTPHTFINSGATQITLTPLSFPDCTVTYPVIGKHTFTVTMNGCDYVLNIEGTVEKNIYAFATDIVCPEGKAIELDNWFPFPNCTVTIKPQSGIKGGKVKSMESGDIALEGEFKKILIEKHGSMCQSEVSENDSPAFGLTVEGRNEIGVPTAIAISD
jgi:hypothetical protein